MMNPTYAATYAAIRAHYLSLPGKTPDGWERNVANNPARFNQVWRHWLKLPAGNDPPNLKKRKR